MKYYVTLLLPNIQKLSKMAHLKPSKQSVQKRLKYEKIKNIHSSIGQRKFRISHCTENELGICVFLSQLNAIMI